MKIVKVSIKNLNSLKGSHEIDFSKEPLYLQAYSQLLAQRDRERPQYWMPLRSRFLVRLRVTAMSLIPRI